METTLVINIGSASKKYALYAENEEFCSYHFEKEDGHFVVTKKQQTQKEKTTIEENDYLHSTAYILKHITDEKKDVSITKVGIRVVAPGTYFHTTQYITDTYIEKLKAVLEMAPLHIAPTLAEISQLPHLFPNIPVIGVSDSAFHTTLCGPAGLYAIPLTTTKKLDLYRFGYHGISIQSVLRTLTHMVNNCFSADCEEVSAWFRREADETFEPSEAPRMSRKAVIHQHDTPTEVLPKNIIICHLGSGASITAVQDGKSFDTSMGFTPLEGIPMATRVGNIDPGALLYLEKTLQLSSTELDSYLNEQCGLLGLSGTTSDMRELISLEQEGNLDAKHAIDYFVYHTKKYIGAYIAALGGLDLLVFTATIGERSFIIRNRIVSGLEELGIILDQEKNNSTTDKNDFIESTTSKTKIAVIHTNEMKEIAHELLKFQRNYVFSNTKKN